MAAKVSRKMKRRDLGASRATSMSGFDEAGIVKLSIVSQDGTYFTHLFTEGELVLLASMIESRLLDRASGKEEVPVA